MVARRLTLGILGLVVCLTGCSGSSSDTGAGGAGAPARPDDASVVEDMGGRSYELHEPATTPEGPAPLLIMLHGFTSAEDPRGGMEAEMHVLPEASKRGIYVAQPLGTMDTTLGSWSWNATDSCCGWNTQANDIGYLHAVVSDIEAKHDIDPKRVFIFGHSNGGFMANRLACDTAGRFAGIVSLAGAPWKDPELCKPSAAIAMLQVHGDADTTVLYDGGPPYNIAALAPAPGAVELTAMWAKKNRCDPTPSTSADPIDVVEDLPGAETHKTIYSGCEDNGATELWTIQGGVHSPNFNTAWAADILDFLMEHPKP